MCWEVTLKWHFNESRRKVHSFCYSDILLPFFSFLAIFVILKPHWSHLPCCAIDPSANNFSHTKLFKTQFYIFCWAFEWKKCEQNDDGNGEGLIEWKMSIEFVARMTWSWIFSLRSFQSFHHFTSFKSVFQKTLQMPESSIQRMNERMSALSVCVGFDCDLNAHNLNLSLSLTACMFPFCCMGCCHTILSFSQYPRYLIYKNGCCTPLEDKILTAESWLAASQSIR